MNAFEKKDCKNLISGDTFAIKINIGSKYDGRFLIVYKVEPKEILPDNNFGVRFKVKITPDDLMPSTEEEIKKLENVKLGFCHSELRYLPMRGLETWEEGKKDKSI